MVVEGERAWQDQKVHQLYRVAVTSRYPAIRHEVMVLLSALNRAGSRDATWAINDIKKKAPVPFLR